MRNKPETDDFIDYAVSSLQADGQYYFFEDGMFESSDVEDISLEISSDIRTLTNICT